MRTLSGTLLVAALTATALLAAGFAPLRAYADEVAFGDEVTEGPDYVAALVGGALPSKDLGTRGSGLTLSGIYGRSFAPRWSYEINLQTSTFETGRSAGTDYYQHGALLDLSYALLDRRERTPVTPFALLGVGAAYDDLYPNNRDRAVCLVEAGVGVVTRPLFANGIRLRADARYVRDSVEGGHGEGRLIAGIEIPLGRVQHSVRYLPGTPEIRTVVEERAPPRADADGDGVDDEHDRCPGTPHGLEVGADGCVLHNQNVGLQGVAFDTNTARLTLNAMTVLDLVSTAFAGQPSLRVEIAGHTDGRGSTRANLALSQARAAAVKNYFVSKGVQPDRLVAHGYGKSQPLVHPEVSAADRERNRRVELRVLAH